MVALRLDSVTMDGPYMAEKLQITFPHSLPYISTPPPPPPMKKSGYTHSKNTLVKFNQDYGHPRLSNTFLVRLTKNSMLEINQGNVKIHIFLVKLTRTFKFNPE